MPCMPLERAAPASSSYALTPAERQMLQGTWPIELIEDPSRQPRLVTSAHEFLSEVLVGEHLGEFVLLRNGIDILDFREEDCLPQDLIETLDGCNTVFDWLGRIEKNDAFLDRYKACIQYIDHNKEQRSVLPKERCNLRKRVQEIQKMVNEGRVDKDLLYITEFRLQKQEPHPLGNEKTKSVVRRGVRDILGPYVPWTLYWDRHDEGVFVGTRPSGKGVHVDQVLWSNVGKNWRGYKLVAAWPKGECSCQVVNENDENLFSMPPNEKQLDVLQKAAKVILVRPGDVFLFSGGTAHTVLCVSEGLSISAYESIISLHPTHVEHFFNSGATEGPYALDNVMPQSELEDLKDDVLDQLEDAADQLSEFGGPRSLPLTSEKVPATWHSIMADLQADERLQKTICDSYARAVGICVRDSYIKTQIAQRVLRAAKACRCGSFADASAVLSRWASCRPLDEVDQEDAAQKENEIPHVSKRRCYGEGASSSSPDSGHSV